MPPPELASWQLAVLDAVARLPLAKELRFGGGSALAAVYLHHRRSEDLDFFAMREVDLAELRPLTRALVGAGMEVDVRVLGVRTALLLRLGDAQIGRVDVAYYPYESIARAVPWRGLAVEPLVDMTVNKVQAVLTRFQPRDYVDLWFLLREGPERDLDRLLSFVRTKFDVGADRLALAERLLRAKEIAELPEMIRPVSREELVTFCESLARSLTRR